MSDLDPKDLTPGKLDGWAERAFTYGACAALAIAIHDAKGWALVKMTDSHNVSRRLPNGRYLDMEGQPEEVRAVVVEAGGGSALHWMVLRPDGRLVDVDGSHDPAEALADFEGDADNGEGALGTASREDAVEEYIDGQGEPISIKLAATFVKAVLARP